jgi:hypothetical protein
VFRRGALKVALYWDGYFTALRPEADNGGDFAALFTEMAAGQVFQAG